MKNNKIDFQRIMVAVGTGATFGGAAQVAAKNIQFVNDHYTMVRSGAAGLFGAALMYFAPNDKNAEAAAFALLGIAGDSGARAVANAIENADNTPPPVQGLGQIAPQKRALLENICANVGKKRLPMPGKTGGLPQKQVIPIKDNWLTNTVNWNILGMA